MRMLFCQLKSFCINILLIIIFTVTLQAQTSSSATDGFTPPGLTPGAPAGSYPLSDFDNVNLYNGNLNFSLPLHNIAGRGGVNVSIVHNIETKWQVDEFHEPGYDIYEPNEFWWHQKVEYGPGMVVMRYITYGTELPPSHDPCSTINDSLTTLTFIGPDGTEYALRDKLTDGEPLSSEWGCGSAPSRGTVFASLDGESMTFISNATINDLFLPGSGPASSEGFPSGVLIFKDGTRYTVSNGLITRSTDRNGNEIYYTYDTTGDAWKITHAEDSLGREVDFEYSVSDIAPYGLCDRIIFKGSGGDERIIRISKAALDYPTLRPGSGYEPQTYTELFPELSGTKPGGYGLYVTSAIWLPDGSLHYKFYYNPYGELARVELPTGGAFEYDYTPGSGVGGGGSPDRYYILRRLVEKRIYPDGGTGGNFAVKQTYTNAAINQTYPGESSTTVEFRNTGGHLIAKSKHYFYGTNAVNFYPLGIHIPGWKIGREFKTESFATDGATVLTRSVKTWEQQSVSWWSGSADRAPINHPVISEERKELVDANLVSKVEYDHDSFNNVTDIYSYDFGAGTPGSLLRRQHTEYVTNSNYTSHTSSHLRGLPLQTWISSDSAGNNRVSLTQYEYDNYDTDTNHASLISRSSVVGHDTSNYGTGFGYRGNITGITSYSNAQAQTGAVSTYAQYDILGNVVKTIDANGNAITIGYNDNFGAPDGDAKTTSQPSELNGQNTFAFPTSTTNALSWTSHIQYDYFTGAPVNTQDINEVVSKTVYNDALDRPTQSVRAVDTSLESQTTVVYDDTNCRIQTTSDLNTLNDNLLKLERFYDGLGRTIESRTYKDGGYINVKIDYDALGRVSRVSNPYRPLMSETPVWIETTFDSLGRVTRVETPDGATVESSFSGNAVTVTDQAGKLRRSITNALGQLIRFDEPNSSNQLGSISSPNQATYYYYSTLGKLVRVNQGVQDRYFMYDSLGRLLRIRQPEQEVNSALNTSGNPNNNSWTVGFTYDANGNILTTTDANNVTITSTYDALNRQVTRSYSDSTPTVTYTYDDSLVQFSKGKLAKVSSSVSESRYTGFDAAGRLLEYKQITDGETYTSSYEYNLFGALTQETYPSGRVVQNALDAHGDLAIVKSRKNANQGFWNYAGNFSYNASGAVTSMRLGNGLWEKSQYNSRSQVSQLALGVTSTDTSLWKVDYEFGELQTDGTVDAIKNNGDIGKQTLTVPGTNFVQTYKYDPLNRLTEAKEKTGSTQNWIQQFGYDRYGNRTSFNQTIGSTNINTTPAIDADTNRFDDNDFTYDANGNVVGDIDPMTSLGRTFTFNGDNKQVEVKRNGITMGGYYYDGEGRRVKKVTDTETTVFVYSAGKLIAEYSTELSQTPSVSYLTNDHLGSPRIITNENGQVNSRRDFMPFGEDIYQNVGGRTSGLKYGASEDDVRQKFTGYQKDNETGLDFAEARMYENRFGRFTAVDSLMVSASPDNPQSWNRYIYTFNNPLKFIDPSGMIVVNDYFINRDGSYIVVENDCKCDTYYLETEKDSGEYRKITTLQENDAGLVEFPAEMDFFTRYGSIDRGGGDHGAGDHFVQPEVAAALFGLSAVLKDEHGISMAFGDMSSSNGRDPWQQGMIHHSGHGHNSRSGLDVDFRYLNTTGESFQSRTARSDSQFSVSNNQIVYDIAKNFGFTENYQGNVHGRNTGLRGPKPIDGHNDHGHIGFNVSSTRVTTAQGVQIVNGIVKPMF